MVQFSFAEKMKTLLNIVSSSPFFIFLIIFFILLGIVLFDSINYEKRKIKRLYVIIYMTVFLAIIIKYNSSLLQLVDYLVNNIFVIIYYPNLAVYILMIIIANVLVIRSVFKKDMPKYIKVINIICYCMKIFLMFLILDNITTNQIDVYSQLSIYSNNKLTILVELSSGLFFIWIIILFIVWLVNKLTNVIIDDKKTVKVVNDNLDTRQEEMIVEEKIKQGNDIFSDDDYIMMLNLIQLSREDEYIKNKLEERVLMKDKE